MEIKTGDIVTCIDDSFTTKLKRNKTYTVQGVVTPPPRFDVTEVKLFNIDGLHNIMRFMKMEEKPNTVDEGVKASKNDSDKIDLSLIPRIALEECAKAFMVGEKKYSRYNYCKGHKASQLVAAAMRHLTAWFEREEHDKIDGQHHLGSVMACCSMILRQQELNTLKDDRDENHKK